MPHNRILGYGALTRSKIILNTVTSGLLLIVCAALQVSFFGRFRFFGAVPDLMICTVLCISYFRGKYAGAITGIGAGFFIEALGSVGISLLPLFYLFLGYVAGHYARAIHPKRYAVYLFYLMFTVVFRMIITVTYIGITYESFHLLEIVTRILLPEAADTAVAGCILYFPIKALCGWLMRRK
jgi:rod shape-determining protein MreD